jgi:hypothetical protein
LHCWQHYVTRPGCQQVFPISGFFCLNTKLILVIYWNCWVLFGGSPAERSVKLCSTCFSISICRYKHGNINYVKRIRKDQQYVLICTTPLLYALAATCFGSSLPSSGSFLKPPELLEIQIEWVVHHIMCGYVTTRYMICISSNLGGSKKLPDDGTLLPKHVGANT